MADQAGRIAVVTGGGRGLGRQIALGLAARGAVVAAVARKEPELAETERLARAAGGDGRVVPFAADVAEWGSVSAMADRVRAELGTPTILVNAAGMFGPISLIHESDPEDWVRTVMVDGIAPYLTTRAFLAGMLAEGWGRIVSVTSAASLHPPGALNSAYGTAKVALNQFTRHLAAEIEGTGVTANVIHPGDVRTDMWADIRDRSAALGPLAQAYTAWADWVEETGGDPPHKAVDLVLRLTCDAGGGRNGEFCWIEEPLQAPIPSWDKPTHVQPWLQEAAE